MKKEEVLAAIDAAFPEFPIPDPQTIVEFSETGDGSSTEAIRNEFGGKSWRSLILESPSQWESKLNALSPEGYRYYLPAFLIEALQEFSDDSSFLHRLLLKLCPFFWLVYHEGDDLDLRARQAVFTPVQYQAVCAFLGLVIAQLPFLRYRAMQALHWGWNQMDTPALAAANQYYQEMRSFSYPGSEDPKIEALCQEIRTAFAATPYPGDNALCEAEPGWEGAEYAIEFRGLKWQSAHPILLARSYSALSFLSEAGLRYFLPAYLLADLMGDALGYWSNAEPVFKLTFSSDASLHDFQLRRWERFNLAERIAIIHYLEYRAMDEDDASDINQALEEYWRPSVQSLKKEAE
ncbi:MAG TPA: DUF6714 family protein [Chthonomonadaceae bacterium]|nr:DUF6714 family protein [Chthonomonadaceae bacterium]